MKKTLIIILFLFLAININAQKSDLIVGKWVFTKALNKDICHNNIQKGKGSQRPNKNCKTALL